MASTYTASLGLGVRSLLRLTKILCFDSLGSAVLNCAALGSA